MNFKQLTLSSRTNTLNFLEPHILHVVPDYGLSTADLLFDSGIQMNNCFGVVTKSATTKLGNRTFNTRKLYLDAKKAFGSNDATSQDKHKILQVFQTMPGNLEEMVRDRKFLIVDHTVISEAAEYMTGMTTVKNGTFFLTQQLKKEFLSIKTSMPGITNTLVFLLGPTRPQPSIIDLIEQMAISSQTSLNDNLKIFDKFILAIMALKNSKPIIMPIASYTKFGAPQMYKPNVSAIQEIYAEMAAAPMQAPQEEVPTDTSSLPTGVQTFTTAKQLAKDIIAKKPVEKKAEIKDHKIVTSMDVNQKQLSKILRKYQIKDKAIADNIRMALDSYLSSTNREVTEDNLERIILLAINKTIFNSDEIENEYLHNPAKLFAKLEEINTYAKEVSYPDLKGNVVLKPNETIELKRVTGLVRHEYEFGSDQIHQNVKESFKALERRTDFPIKVMKVSHEYQDNNLNRVINYEVTLKNLAGGYQEPYTVNIKVPALVNDRYFKLNGKTYVMSNQQFFTPLTKTEPDESRLLTAYAMMTLSVMNMKLNVSEIDKIIDYIGIHYPELVVKINMDKNKVIGAILKDKFGREHNFDVYGNVAYIGPKEALECDEDTGKWNLTIDGKTSPLTIGKSEYLYARLIEIMQTINPEETLRKSPKSIPYIQTFITGLKMPLIVYLWQQIGLAEAFKKTGIDFEISKEVARGKAVTIPLEDGKFLHVYTETKKEELIANGLLTIDLRKYHPTEADLSKGDFIDKYVNDKNGTRATYNLNLMTVNMIDPVAKDLLEYQDRPTNLIDLACQDMVDKLLNDKADSLTDLKIYRSRQAELIFHMLYKELTMAHNTYKNEMKYNKDAKIFMQDDYILQTLLGVHRHTAGDSAVELANLYNPVAELKAAAKLIKTGPGGVPNKRSFKKEHRNIHPSYYGNIGANATTEYADVGIVNHMTLTPLLSNRYGSYGSKDITKVSGWEMLSLDEALVPFINELQADRAVLAYTHRAQIAPIVNGEIPLVATGAEYLVPQLASARFIHRAPEDGVVEDVSPDKYVKVKYSNNKTEYFDITPRLATTKRASYIRMAMNTLSAGTKFKKDDPLAWMSAFNGEGYSTGRNLVMAVMNYMGFSHEDGYVVSRDAADKYETETVEEVNAIIPLHSKITKIITQKQNTEQNEVLVEFGFAGNLDDYIDQYNLLDEEAEETELAIYDFVSNKIQIKSPGGEIVDIRVYVNSRNDIDPTVLNVWKDVVKDLKDRQKLYSTGKTTQRDKIATIDNLDMSQLKIGTHKFRGIEIPGARIVFYVKKTKRLEHGDKVCNRYGGKGVVTKVLHAEEAGRAEFSGDIDIFISPLSVIGRKNLASIKELYIGKIFYNLPKVLAKKAAKPNANISSLRKIILDIYQLLDGTKEQKYYNLVKKNLDKIVDDKLRKLLEDEGLRLNFIVEPFVNIPLVNINNAAAVLGIPLDEKVYIPALKAWTKKPVPVGIQYVQAMEQLAEDYESLRSTGGYRGATGQPQKGRANMGGQSVGNWDLYSLLSFDVPNGLKELMTVRSDDKRSQRQMVVDIIENGEANIPTRTGDAATKDLYRVHMIAMGLNP